MSKLCNISSLFHFWGKENDKKKTNVLVKDFLKELLYIEHHALHLFAYQRFSCLPGHDVPEYFSDQMFKSNSENYKTLQDLLHEPFLKHWQELDGNRLLYQYTLQHLASQTISTAMNILFDSPAINIKHQISHFNISIDEQFTFKNKFWRGISSNRDSRLSKADMDVLIKTFESMIIKVLKASNLEKSYKTLLLISVLNSQAWTRLNNEKKIDYRVSRRKWLCE